jgi:hypothetical protein
MASMTYESTLELARSLSPEERLQLIRELADQPASSEGIPVKTSVLDLCGLGAEIWEGIDAQTYVDAERSTWGG